LFIVSNVILDGTVATIGSNSSSPAYDIQTSTTTTYYFNNYHDSGYVMSGSLTDDFSYTPFRENGSLNFTGGTGSNGTVTKIVESNVTSQPSSGTEIITFSDSTQWTYNLATGSFTQSGGGGSGGGGGGYTYTGSTGSVNSVVNALYSDALSQGATPVTNTSSPVAPSPPVSSQLESYLAAAEADAWAVACESYQGKTSTAQQIVGLMLTNLQSAYNLSSSLNPQGYPDQANYPGVTYAEIASALTSVGMTP
jgi:hypothetical protein